MLLFGSMSPWSALPQKANCLPTCIMASGSPWIPCATRTTSRRCGPAERLPGKHGNRYIILGGESRVPHWPYGLQGRLVILVVAGARRESYRLLFAATH